MVLVSVIVPAFNEEKLLGRTLDAVRDAAGAWVGRGWSWELIVCDNNSTDRTAAIAAEHGAKVVHEPINQISRARNRGASVARGRWLLFIDADSLPSPALFADLAEAISSDKHLACGSVIHFPSTTLLLRSLALCWQLWSRLLNHMAGSFVAVESTAFHSIGGFSEDLFIGEELDLSQRLKHLGRDRYPAQSIRILTRHPLLTSDRKAHLYSFRETLFFGLRSFLVPWRTMRQREACHLWYDGRR